MGLDLSQSTFNTLIISVNKKLFSPSPFNLNLANISTSRHQHIIKLLLSSNKQTFSPFTFHLNPACLSLFTLTLYPQTSLSGNKRESARAAVLCPAIFK